MATPALEKTVSSLRTQLRLTQLLVVGLGGAGGYATYSFHQRLPVSRPTAFNPAPAISDSAPATPVADQNLASPTQSEESKNSGSWWPWSS